MSILSRIRKILTYQIGLLPILLSSCMGNPLSSSSSSSLSENVSSSMEESVDSSLSFPKGEDGFKVFDKSYFEPISNLNDSKETSLVKFGDRIDEIDASSSFKMFLAGEEAPVYKVKINQARVWNKDTPERENSSVSSFSLKGKVKVFLQCSFNPKDDVTIRPLGRKIEYSVDKARWVITFSIDTPGQYLIETRYRTLHLFVNELKETPSNAIIFKAGLHTKENDTRINQNDEIILHNGNNVYLEEGAIVRAKFKAYDAYNFSIKGPGFIDGSTFIRDVDKNIANVPLDISFSENIELEDFAILDPAGWAYNLYFSKNINIKNTKVISSRSNGDGISIQSCKYVNVDSCFVRSWDDSLVVKNYVNWRNSYEGETYSIHFSNCLIVTDLAQSMEIGYECIGEKMEDITFDNMSILHAYHKPIFSIHNGNNAKIRGVKYSNITVEDCSIGKGDGTSNLFDFDVSHSSTWSDNHKITPLGDIDNVSIKNIKVLSGISSPKIKIKGSLETRSQYPNLVHKITNVSFEDVEIYGQKIDTNYANLETKYAEGVTFNKTNDDVTGAIYSKKDVSSFSANIQRIK